MEGATNATTMIKSLKERKDHQAIPIWEVRKAWVDSMQQKIKVTPHLLHKSVGHSSCCIFRVPQSLVEVNRKAYQPHIVSIGPYHHGSEHLKLIEEHKWRFLGSLLDRTQKFGRGLEDYLKAIVSMEKIKNCYSETISFNTGTFVEMMVLDGCFIIELFRKVGKLVPVDPDDPIFTMPWVFPFLMRDLLRLENQLPFFVLQCLYDLSNIPSSDKTPSLAFLALSFFNNTIQRPDEVIQKYYDLDGLHLLDLFRSSFLPKIQEESQQVKSSVQIIQNVSKLRQAGIRFKPGRADSFLDIKFRHGALEIPPVTIDDFTSSVFLNFVAFEQCYRNCSMYITTYATFLDCLINTPRDVGFLRDSNIIENYFGTDEEVARFFNNLGKDVAFDIKLCYLSNLFEQVNEYYKKDWHVQWASFKHTYFETPWSFISALAAVILLLLTLTQTFFAVYGYFRPPL
ncbi:hypothetical protein FRX31_004655 [Thalictrum thalictroides]|uniref:Uncharacterized protein n=1 Tax=Thalictrum thalictroides TaxID=46969 RepID=A0A7J6X9U8_THATH|nr:hypothetical protein FRX31_004655 [Thalictrum thalictroides]